MSVKAFFFVDLVDPVLIIYFLFKNNRTVSNGVLRGLWRHWGPYPYPLRFFESAGQTTKSTGYYYINEHFGETRTKRNVNKELVEYCRLLFCNKQSNRLVRRCEYWMAFFTYEVDDIFILNSISILLSNLLDIEGITRYRCCCAKVIGKKTCDFSRTL